MAQLRKMLGDINSEECIRLMRLIETQSKETLANWAFSYAEQNYCPIYRRQAEEDRLTCHLAVCRGYLEGRETLKEAKAAVREMRGVAQQLAKNPTAQAAARAVSTGCAAMQTPTNAFGFLLYGAAAVAYDQLGLQETKEQYDAAATQELKKAFQSLQAAAVLNEPNPAKIIWGC